MENAAECRVVRPVQGYVGKQGVDYGAGISAETAGSTACACTPWSSRRAAARATPICTSTTSRRST